MRRRFLNEALQHGLRLVRRSVIDDDDFQGMGGIVQHEQGAQAAFKLPGPVAAGDEDGDARPRLRRQGRASFQQPFPAQLLAQGLNPFYGQAHRVRQVRACTLSVTAGQQPRCVAGQAHGAQGIIADCQPALSFKHDAHAAHAPVAARCGRGIWSTHEFCRIIASSVPGVTTS